MLIEKQKYNHETNHFEKEFTEIPVFEMTDEEKAKLNIPQHLVFYTVDHESLMLSGVKRKDHFIGIDLNLKHCSIKERDDCFSDELIQQYMVRTALILQSQINFIDFFEVESEQQTLKKQEVTHLNVAGQKNAAVQATVELQEYRTELSDSWLPLLMFENSFELDYLNLEASPKISSLNTPDGEHQEFSFQVYFVLSNEITIQRRVVYDVLMMFGDVGGLYDFLILLFAGIFDAYSSKLKNLALIKNLFLVKSSRRQAHKGHEQTGLTSFRV